MFVLFSFYGLFIVNLLGIMFMNLLCWACDYWSEGCNVMSNIEQSSIIFGFNLFVLSEFFLFVSAFGTFINLSLNLSNFGLYSLFPLFSTMAFSLPYSNLLILLTSGFPLMCAQIVSKFGNLELFLMGLIHTLGASSLFICLQLNEFTYSYFSIYDNILGSIFYFTVGTHGSHVIVGSLIIYFILFTFNFVLLEECNLGELLPSSSSNIVVHYIDYFNVFSSINLLINGLSLSWSNCITLLDYVCLCSVTILFVLMMFSFIYYHFILVSLVFICYCLIEFCHSLDYISL